MKKKARSAKWWNSFKKLDKKRKIMLAASFLLCILFVSAVILKYTPSDKRVDLNEYFHLTKENELGITVQSLVSKETALYYNDSYYVPYDFVKTSLNDKFYIDEQEELLLYAKPDALVKVPFASKDFTQADVSLHRDYEIVMEMEGRMYVALSFVQEFTNIQYEVYENPARIMLWNSFAYLDSARTVKDAVIREGSGIKTSIVTDVKKDGKLYVSEQWGDWSHVYTEDGYTGYIQNKYLSDITNESKTTDFIEPVYTHQQMEETPAVGWVQVYSKEENASIDANLADTQGINVVCPTWFVLNGSDGAITSYAEKKYVTKLHKEGKKVWALVNNIDKETDVAGILAATSKRQTLIQNLMTEVRKYELDGINVDFENLEAATADAYIEFIRELSIECRNAGIVLSVDNYVPYSYNQFYNRKAQAQVADYVVIMDYDEHYDGSEAGSVSSMSFFENGIKNTLSEVPKEQIICAIPFYTRIWDGTSGKAVGMSELSKLLKEKNITTSYDETSGQNYAEYEENGKTLNVWIEDLESVEKRMALIQKYDIAGVAFWKLGLEPPDVWETILRYLP